MSRNLKNNLKRCNIQVIQTCGGSQKQTNKQTEKQVWEEFHLHTTATQTVLAPGSFRYLHWMDL